MQNLPATRVGELVRVRRLRWRVTDVRAHAACHIVTLVGLDASNARTERRVIVPFDVLDRVATPSRLTRIRRGRWQGACRALIADQMPPGGLLTAAGARMELLPHQLEPALTILRGQASRVLLADEVGLGKTVQAGLILSELRARGAADRALVLTPPGLRDQWAAELGERFGVDAAVMDAGSLRRLACTLPVGTNPWRAAPVAIASIDFVKRSDVLPTLFDVAWDLVVVDEAHGAVGASDRHQAIESLATRASYVVLLTATPHSGDRRAFQSLTATGLVARDDDPLLVFRRTRSEVNPGVTRHVHRMQLRPAAAEIRMHAWLDAFARVVREERGRGASLALSVLYKRAFSSAHSLRCSIDRRLAALSDRGAPDFEQLALPIDDPSGEYSSADAPPEWPSELRLNDIGRERRLLGSIRAAALAASKHETKVGALKRLIRRLHEPVIVFTEYRDTLRHLERHLDCPLVLHGGLTRDERRDALNAFASGTRPVLLATDAAGEGLNLHRSCRVVINLELPWNPTRLEQRIGRVDRIGQRRRVHAIHLIGRATRETDILDRLQARIERANLDIGAPDPLGLEFEHRMARLVVENLDEEHPAFDDGDRQISSEPPVELTRLRTEAADERIRLTFARRILRPGDTRSRAGLEAPGPAIATANRWQTRQRLGGATLVLWKLALHDTCGRLMAWTLVPVRVDASHAPANPDEVVGWLNLGIRSQVDRATARWRGDVVRAHTAFVAARLRRDRHIARSLPAASSLFQGGLFDRRTEIAHTAALDSDLDRRKELAARIAELERSGTIELVRAELVLVLS